MRSRHPSDSVMSAICRLDLFRTCSDKEREAAARAFDLLRVPAGTELLRQDAPAREFLVVVEGVTSVRRDGVEVATVGSAPHGRGGECLGEIALLDGGRRTATVMATTDVVVLICGPREFAGLCAVAPNFTRRVATILAARLRDTEALLHGSRPSAA